MSKLVCSNADIEWRENVPYSRAFEDIYFQVENGLEESRHVFLEPNQITQRLKTDQRSSSPLRIFETGFGSGLNFIATLQAWTTLPDPKRPLHYTSVEGFPLTLADMERVRNSWPELSDFYDQLINQYPEPIRTCHTLSFADGRVTLRLIQDDLSTAIEQFSPAIDAWYLDGFAPSSNSDMWTEKLFSFIANHSSPHASVSTFTAAGFVKRNLSAVGFKVEKIKGFGKKREMITATMEEQNQGQTTTQLPTQPWHLSTQDFIADNQRLHSPSEAIAVVGAGIAGLTSALSLANAGLKVTLLDAHTSPLCGASGQPQLIMYGKYPRKPSPEARLLLNAQLFSQQFYKREQEKSEYEFWYPIGVAQLAWNEKERERQAQFLSHFGLPATFVQHLNIEQMRKTTGVNVSVDGLFFAQAGWLDTQKFAAHVLNHPNIEFIADYRVERLSRNVSRPAWDLWSEGSLRTFHAAILCTAGFTQSLIDDLRLPTRPLRGQTTQLSASNLEIPKTVLCGEGYLCPGNTNSELHLGASYDLERTSPVELSEDNTANVEQLLTWLPDWQEKDDLLRRVAGCKAGIRTTSSDYTPIVGRATDEPAIRKALSGLTHNARAHTQDHGQYHENLYINCAYGSKGVTYAPAGADLITSKLLGVGSGMNIEMEKMLNPSRFIIRQMKRGNV